MPQMGESIAEGTIVRWMKKVGDAVERDEPLFEISTDKVDAEIPSPAAGVVDRDPGARKARRFRSTASSPSSAKLRPARRPRPVGRRAPAARRAPLPPPRAPSQPVGACARCRPSQPCRHPSRRPSRAPRPSHPRTEPRSAAEARELAQRSSPLVRKIAQEHHVDISQHRRHRHRRPRDEGRHPRRSSTPVHRRSHRVAAPPAPVARRAPSDAGASHRVRQTAATADRAARPSARADVA